VLQKRGVTIDFYAFYPSSLTATAALL